MCLLHTAEAANFNCALLPPTPLSHSSESLQSTPNHPHRRHQHYYRQQVPLHYTPTPTKSKAPPKQQHQPGAVQKKERRLASFYLSDEEEDEALMLKLNSHHHQLQQGMSSSDPPSSYHHRHARHACSKSRARAKAHGLGLICCKAPDSTHLPGGAFKSKLNAVINAALSPIPEGPPPSFSQAAAANNHYAGASHSMQCYQWRVDPTDYAQFRERLLANKVALEAVEITDTAEGPQSPTGEQSACLSGLVRVLNVSRKKRVFVRVTADGWSTHEEYKATYQGSSQQFTENFSFQIPLPSAGEATRLEFRCGYSTESPANGQPAGTTYWDTNEGLNYVLHTEPISLPVIEEEVEGSDDETGCARGDDSGFSSWKDLAGSEEKPYW